MSDMCSVRRNAMDMPDTTASVTVSTTKVVRGGSGSDGGVKLTDSLGNLDVDNFLMLDDGIRIILKHC